MFAIYTDSSDRAIWLTAFRTSFYFDLVELTLNKFQIQIQKYNPFFNNLEKEVFRKKYCGKWRKCWLPAFSPFPSAF